MDNPHAAPAPKFTLPGCALAVVTGAIAAGAVGYAYYFVANVVGIDLIILLACLVGIAVGWVTGQAARLGRLRSSPIVLLFGLAFGVASYGARYAYEFDSLVDAVVEEHTPPGGAPGETRAEFLELWAEEYPPGGYVGYLRYAAETGFTLSDDLFTDQPTGSPTRGVLVWLLFAMEACLASFLSAVGAHAAAIGPIGQARRKYAPRRMLTRGPREDRGPD